MANEQTFSEYSNSSITDYYQLLKPRVMSLVVFTGLCGMLVAPNASDLHPFIAVLTVFCIALGSGASGAINMWYDRDIDIIMERTKNRPIPAGRVDPNEALGFGIIMAIASVILLSLATNFVAGGLLLAAILFYVFIYTIWLKRRTPQNIVIGGASGAFPPMIGWAAVTGDVTLMPIVLFAIIFFWTPPHFWALSLLIKDDYKNAAVPMLPVVSGVRVTKINIIVYTIILFAITLIPLFIGFSNWIYTSVAVVMGTYFFYLSLRIMRDKNNSYARKTFLFSILYLFILYLALVIDKLIF
jgi:protoheme IX farnesyltransferase